MQAIDNLFFNEKLKHWFKQNQRDLPWRHTTNPYFIWLSEIILQQTRVAQGLPYYLKFINAFPTIDDFAHASEMEILRLWQGLGYYSRARNMHFTAKYIQKHHHSVFPDNYNDLLKLKGIGSYTAAAIASFSFNEHVAVLDGNVFRVLSRFFGIEMDILSPKGKKTFTELANAILPINGSSSHNQAIMEFGALQCTPSPNCESCPLANSCFAFRNKVQSRLPVKIKKLKIKNRFLYYFVFEKNETFFMKKREGKGIWEGLFDFYLVENSQETDIDDLAEKGHLKNILDNAIITSFSNEYKHILTHQKLSIWFIIVKLNGKDDRFYRENKKNFYSKKEIEALPKPIILANYFKENLL